MREEQIRQFFIRSLGYTTKPFTIPLEYGETAEGYYELSRNSDEEAIYSVALLSKRLDNLHDKAKEFSDLRDAMQYVESI